MTVGVSSSEGVCEKKLTTKAERRKTEATGATWVELEPGGNVRRGGSLLGEARSVLPSYAYPVAPTSKGDEGR